MSLYFRPVSQFGPARPAQAERIAQGWCWFSEVEVLERGRAPRIVPASALPDEVRARICAPRAALAGLTLSAPRIMGIVNATPDSFSDGGVFNAPEKAGARVREMVAQGADIIDIGGESTRPGAQTVPVAEEIARSAPVVRAACDAGVPLSIDTRKAPVAAAALAAGATMVNDVSAFNYDPQMIDVVAKNDVPVCLMHSRSDPRTMQDNPVYDDVLLDVFDHLRARLDLAERAGIARERIIVDPGIGFGKTLEHNLALLRRLDLFHALGCAVLLGASRKRFIGTLSGEEVAERRVAGSLGVALAALGKGVQIVRVHDVRETRQAVALWHAASGLCVT